MNKEEYIARMNAENDWAPGWDAIEAEFARLYPGQEPAHFATDVTARAMFGGDSYLDGFSVYDSGRGYQHIVTFGMSELYTDEEAFGGTCSRWGFEMTIKVKADAGDPCYWALSMLQSLGRYTYQTARCFGPGAYMLGNGTPICQGADSQITGLIAVADTSAQTLQTIHGEVAFVQFVGITTREADVIRADASNIEVLVEKMRKDNPELVTDLARSVSYL